MRNNYDIINCLTKNYEKWVELLLKYNIANIYNIILNDHITYVLLIKTRLYKHVTKTLVKIKLVRDFFYHL